MAFLLLALVAGSLVYSALTVIAAFQYRRVRPPELRDRPPISVLKPLAGAEDGLDGHLASFFEQDYPEFEVLLAVALPDDAALPVAERVRRRYPRIPSQVIVTGASPWPNAKDYSLHHMLAAARHNLIVMADSDVRVGSDLLATLAAEFQDPGLSFATCPYRAAPGGDAWSTLEAIGLNTEMLGGILVARMIEGMKLIVGPTVAARREAIAAIGGFEPVGAYTSDDLMMGRIAAGRGLKIVLSSYAIEHHLGRATLGAAVRHRLRWNRAMRRISPWSYAGQVFMNPLPLAALLCLVNAAWWPAFAAALAFRMASAWATAWHSVRDPLTRRLWWLLPVSDAVNFASWLACFFGNSVEWRGRRFRLTAGGKCVPAAPGATQGH